jgi:hypothetical protein
MDTQRVCSIPGCIKPHLAKGYCQMHYMRVWTKGTPDRDPRKADQIIEWVERVALLRVGNECLAHPFKKNKAGYCFFKKEQVSWTLHRYICERHRGPAPKGMNDASHECGNAWCGLPDHLSWKTRSSNLKDKIRHGTHLQGEQFYASKLTERQVREIRELSKTISQREIARRLGLGYKHVWHILHDTWKHVK